MTRKTHHLLTALLMFGPLHGQGLIQHQAKVDPAVTDYVPRTEVAGEIAAVGSDPLAVLFDGWTAGFRRTQPGAQVRFTPSTTPPAVKAFLAGQAQMAFLAREMTPEENRAFEAKHGYPALRIPLCIDATIVFVNRSNPMKRVRLAELDAIYGIRRLGGAEQDVRTWGDLGLRGEWTKRPIAAYSREKSTAICQLFREQALLKGEFKADILERPDAPSVAEAVITDPGGIGFAPIMAWYAANKVLPVVPYHAEEAVPPSQEAVTAGRYPMTRLNYLYLNRVPGKPLPDGVREFAAYVLSRQGQTDIAEAGLFPAPAELVLIGQNRIQ